MKTAIFALVLTTSATAQSFSSGSLPAVAPTYRYNDQYGTTGRSTFGDTGQVVWALNGTVYRTFGDGYGFAPTTGPTGGCDNGNGGANLILSSYSGSAPYLNGSNVNCMTSFGDRTQTNVGACGSNLTWKPQGLADIEDGSTAAGLYLWVSCIQTSTPFEYTGPTLMYSADQGAHWCNPAHCGSSTNANGDAPASNMALFTNENIVRFVQFEQGGTGKLTQDNNNNYIYAMGFQFVSTPCYNQVLMRIARGFTAAQMQTASNWQFYVGTVGGSVYTSGNWSSSDASATVILSCINDAETYWVPGYGYLRTGDNVAGTTPVLYQSQTLTATPVLVYSESLINPPQYGFTSLDMSSLVQSGPHITAYVQFDGNASNQTSNPATNNYSTFWRQLTLTVQQGAALFGASLAGGASIQ